MRSRIIEIAGDGRHLSLSRGFMTVKEGSVEVGRVALDDIAALLCHAHGLTYSNRLMTELAERGVAVVLCADNHLPAAWVWPTAGHHLQTERMRRQIGAGRTLSNRLWQGVVRAKIRHQGALLQEMGRAGGAFEALAAKVRTGDPENIEAQAARRYWSLLMGKSFRRDRNAPGANALLNYGYTVLRAGVARAVCAAGLHPTIGIKHSNRNNPFCLVDDLIEPFRPSVDRIVCELARVGDETLSVDARTRLAKVLLQDIETNQGITPLSTCIERLVLSVVRSHEGGKAVLDLPSSWARPNLDGGSG